MKDISAGSREKAQVTGALFSLAWNVVFSTESAEVYNTWSRQDNYILCTHMKIKTNYIWKCISTVSHDKSCRNKEICGVNASCVLYSFERVFPTRQVLYTSALSVLKTTFHVRENIALVSWYMYVYTGWSYQLVAKHLLMYSTKLHLNDFYAPPQPLSHTDIW